MHIILRNTVVTNPIDNCQAMEWMRSIMFAVGVAPNLNAGALIAAEDGDRDGDTDGCTGLISTL